MTTRMRQTALFDNFPQLERKIPSDGHSALTRADMIESVVATDREAIESIAELHLRGEWWHLDPFFNTGTFWNDIPAPVLKGDIFPQRPDVEEMDARHMPYADGTIGHIMMDPPFLVRTGKGSVIKDEYGAYPSEIEVLRNYSAYLKEAYRVMAPRSVLAFKCQGFINSGTQNFIPHETIEIARHHGFYVLDEIIRVNRKYITSSTWNSQRHAKRVHTHYFVFKKSKRKVITWRDVIGGIDGNAPD